MKTYDDYSEEGAGAALVTTVLVFFALVLGVLTLAPVWAWEEQLEACRIRGIQPADCPDDESYVGIPYTPTTNYFSTNSGRTSYTKWVWVYTETTYYNPEEKICYNSYSRRIQYYPKDRKEVMDFKDVIKNECAKPYQHTINLVFD